MAAYKLNPNMFSSSFGSFAGLAPSSMRHLIGLANMKIKEAYDKQMKEMSGETQKPIGMRASANPQGETARKRGANWVPKNYGGGGGGGGGGLPGAPLKPAGDLSGTPPGQSNIAANAALDKGGSNPDQVGKALQMGSPGYGIDFTNKTLTTPTGGTVQKIAPDTFQQVAPGGTGVAPPPTTEGIQKTAPGAVSPTFIGGDPEEEDPVNEDLLNLYLAQQSSGGAVFMQ
jgi:hypothetical protein